MIQIHSIGMVSTHGRGAGALEKAMEGPWRPPGRVTVPGIEHPVPAFTVPDEVLKDKTVLKNMRRADRTSKMATIAACDAWHKSGLENVSPDRTGVLVATGLGPHVRTFKFLNGILDFGDASVSPTDFSHSVHNAAAGYITTRLRTHGPVQTLTDFDFAFNHALTVAECMLARRRCDAVLAGAVEELGEVMLHVCSRMADVPADGRPSPVAFSDNPSAVPGEGAVFFALTRPDENAEGPFITAVNAAGPEPDITILDAEGLSGPESGYLPVASASASVANYTPFFGSMMTGNAFQCAIAAMMVRSGRRFASQPNAGERDIKHCGKGYQKAAETIDCIKLDKEGHKRTIRIDKTYR